MQWWGWLGVELLILMLALQAEFIEEFFINCVGLHLIAVAVWMIVTALPT